MQIVVVGANHKTMPIELRERLAILKPKLIEALTQQQGKPFNEDIKERVILSTCNRVEVYAITTNAKKGKAKIIDFLSQYYCLEKTEFKNYLYFYQDEEAIRHLFNVAASLDSMVVGEPQILGQVKNAYEEAFKTNGTGHYLDNLFQKAFLVGKKVRSQTEIGKGAVSISFAAVKLAEKIFGKLDGKKILIIGAGKMSEKTAKYLISNKPNAILATNRTYEKAIEIAAKFSGKAIKFDELFNILPEIDIVISSTSAPHFIIKKEDIKNLMLLRHYKPIFFIDIAVPRDIDPDIGKIDGIYLYNIDDLQAVVQSNINLRQKEIVKCHAIIEKETKEFCHWLNLQSSFEV
ncbi:MAG: glutamyl-tRNA reductase [Nitrospirota bacterium]